MNHARIAQAVLQGIDFYVDGKTLQYFNTSFGDDGLPKFTLRGCRPANNEEIIMWALNASYLDRIQKEEQNAEQTDSVSERP